METCGNASPGLHAYTCELPDGHDESHRANVSETTDAVWGRGYARGVAHTPARGRLTLGTRVHSRISPELSGTVTGTEPDCPELGAMVSVQYDHLSYEVSAAVSALEEEN